MGASFVFIFILKGYSPLGKGNLLNDPLIVELASKYGKTPAQIAIRWSLQVNPHRAILFFK